MICDIDIAQKQSKNRGSATHKHRNLKKRLAMSYVGYVGCLPNYARHIFPEFIMFKAIAI